MSDDVGMSKSCVNAVNFTWVIKWYMVFFMATILGDVQYSQNGTFTNPCFTTGKSGSVLQTVDLLNIDPGAQDPRG